MLSGLDNGYAVPPLVLGLVVFVISACTLRFGAVLNLFFRAGWVLLCCSACGVSEAVVLAGLAGRSLYAGLLDSSTVVHCWQVIDRGIWVTAGVLLVLGWTCFWTLPDVLLGNCQCWTGVKNSVPASENFFSRPVS